MTHLTDLQALGLVLGGVIGLVILKAVVKMLWAIAKVMPRVLLLAGGALLCGAELGLLLTNPVLFAAEFVLVAAAAYAWRLFERQNGYSPVMALRRLVHLATWEPTPLQELVEPIEIKPDGGREMPEEMRADPVPAKVRYTETEVFKSQLANWESLWAPGELEQKFRDIFEEGDTK